MLMLTSPWRGSVHEMNVEEGEAVYTEFPQRTPPLPDPRGAVNDTPLPLRRPVTDRPDHTDVAARASRGHVRRYVFLGFFRAPPLLTTRYRRGFGRGWTPSARQRGRRRARPRR